MSSNFIAKSAVRINAPASEVWKWLTKPELIKKYFFGTDTVTDWKVGSLIFFSGEWEGKRYEDKGTILAFEPDKLLRYNYWSSLSGKEDAPENYSNVIYELSEENGETLLSITQDNVGNEEARAHSEANWNKVLHDLKGMVEG